jgi:hypothetical protein
MRAGIRPKLTSEERSHGWRPDGSGHLDPGLNFGEVRKMLLPLVALNALRTMSRPLESIAEGLIGLARVRGADGGVSAFSGLVSSACALASAAAIAPIVSLDRCKAVPLVEKIEADSARLRAPCANAVAGRFLPVLRYERLEFGLGALVVEKGRARFAVEAG